MSVRPDVPWDRGLVDSRHVKLDGTLGGRLRLPTPYNPSDFPGSIQPGDRGPVRAVGCHISLQATSQTMAVGGSTISWSSLDAAKPAVLFDDTVPVSDVPIPQNGYYGIKPEGSWDTYKAGGTLQVYRVRSGTATLVESWTGTVGQNFAALAAPVECVSGDKIRVVLDADDAATQNLASATLSIYLIEVPAEVPSAEVPILDLDARDISGLSNGDPVTTWTDSSGNGNDATTVSGSPTYQTGITPGGHPVVRFTSDVMYAQFGTAIGPQATVLMLVRRHTSNWSNAGVWGLVDANPAVSSDAAHHTAMDESQGPSGDRHWALRYDGSTTVDTTQRQTVWNVVAVVYRSTSEAEIAISGNLSVATVDPNDSFADSDAFTLGAVAWNRTTSSGAGIDVGTIDVAAIRVFNEPLSDTDLQSEIDRLTARYL